MTNTSMLLPSQFAEASGRGDRLLALHFHLPCGSTTYSRMPHPGTAPGRGTQLAVVFARPIGQVPIEMRREYNGYVFNSMYSAQLRGDHARPAGRRVDRANRSRLDARHQGADRPAARARPRWPRHRWSITEPPGPPARRRAAARQREVPEGFYVDRGDVGVKSGRGFYTYPNPTYYITRLHRVT